MFNKKYFTKENEILESMEDEIQSQMNLIMLKKTKI